MNCINHINTSNHASTPRRRKGFTLVEVLIVVGTLAFVLPIITIVLFVIIRQQLTVARMTEVKRQGDQAIAAIQNVLNKEVVSMFDEQGSPVCASTTATVTDVVSFKGAAGNLIKFEVLNDALQITHGQPPVAEVVTDPEKVIVENSPVNPFTIQCFRNAAYTHPLVGITFSIIPAGPRTDLERSATRMQISTKTMIRR